MVLAEVGWAFDDSTSMGHHADVGIPALSDCTCKDEVLVLDESFYDERMTANRLNFSTDPKDQDAVR